MRPFVVLLPRLCSKKPEGKVGQYCRSIKQNEAIKLVLDLEAMLPQAVNTLESTT